MLRLIENSTIPKTIISFSPFTLHQTNKKPEKTNVVFSIYDYGKNPFLNFINNPSRKEYLLTKKASKTQYFKLQLNENQININSINQFKSHSSTNERHAIEYFYKINNICKKNNIRLIYLVTPFPSGYNKFLDSSRFWKEDLNFMKNSKDYEFYDFSKFFETESFDSLHFVDGLI